jgi:hypothetical protein
MDEENALGPGSVWRRSRDSKSKSGLDLLIEFGEITNTGLG